MQNTYTAVMKTPGHIEINMLEKKTEISGYCPE